MTAEAIWTAVLVISTLLTVNPVRLRQPLRARSWCVGSWIDVALMILPPSLVAVVHEALAAAWALFSDAATAVAVVPDGRALEVLDIVASTDVAAAGHMMWEITEVGSACGSRLGWRRFSMPFATERV